MANNMYIDQRDVEKLAEKICVEIDESGFLPDVIVGIGRGGATPGVMLSHYFDIPFVSVAWSTRDGEDQESNCWLPEQAYNGKKILIVDDICDSGRTFNEICEDWDSSIQGLPNYEKWYDNVKFATLHIRKDVDFFVDFYGEEVLGEWVVYPWEHWWS